MTKQRVHTLRTYTVSGRLTRNHDHPREANNRESLQFSVAALPHDEEYDIRLKVGTGQSEATYSYFTRTQFKKALVTTQSEEKYKTRTSGFIFDFPSPTAQEAEAASRSPRITFELFSLGITHSDGLKITFGQSQRGGAHIQLTPAQHQDFRESFIRLCGSQTPVDEFSDMIGSATVSEDGTLTENSPTPK